MFIDQIKHKIPYFSTPRNDHVIKDSIIFYIQEKHNYFVKRNKKNTDIIFPSYFPFNNIFIQFIDGYGLWCVEDIFWTKNFPQIGGRSMSFFIFEYGYDLSLWTEKKEKPRSDYSFHFYYKKDEQLNEDYPNILLNGNPNQRVYKDIGIYDQQRALTGINILCSFIHILSCKNIEVEKKEQLSKVNKKRVKKGKIPLFSYYTLKIKPTSSHKGYEAQNLWSNRVHLCRGHIKTYTEEKPLFGKITGNIWCPPHARGNKKNGVIHKEYSL